jgi:hypothetical protein
MHPETEQFVEAHGGTGGEIVLLDLPECITRRRSGDGEDKA